jgi:dTDP-4-amino-4,6-dideoxygalactose transaminase
MVGDLPMSEASARAAWSLPLYPHMSSSQVQQVAQEVHRLSRKAGQETLLSRR